MKHHTPSINFSTLFICIILLIGSTSSPAPNSGVNEVSYGNTPNILFLLSGVLGAVGNTSRLTYALVNTGQIACYDNENEIVCPESGEAFYGAG